MKIVGFNYFLSFCCMTEFLPKKKKKYMQKFTLTCSGVKINVKIHLTPVSIH